MGLGVSRSVFVLVVSSAVAALSAAGCTATSTSRSASSEPAPALGSSARSPAGGSSERASGLTAPAPLRLRPGDIVRVEIRDDPAMSGQFEVGGDGAILIPVIGIIGVAGRPFDEVVADLRSAYAQELADPVLRVTPLVRIAVLGEVLRPALLPVDPTHTIGDVLALAGGFTPLADRGDIVLVRDGERIPIAVEPDSPVLLEPLRSGDRIVVGRKSWLSQNLAIFVGAAASVAAAAVTSWIVR